MHSKSVLPAISSNQYKEIQRENDYYKSIIENNSFYIIKTDLEGKYTYMNPFFCHMLSINCADWMGKYSLSLIIPEDHQACMDAVTACFASPLESHWVILRKPVPKGIISTQWEFKMLSNDDGVPSEILCIGHDITSLILRQEELETLVGITADQNKRLVNFTYIVSHNIRSHVANIIGIVNVNKFDEEMNDQAALDMIETTANSLDETIHNLNEIIGIQTNINLPVKEINIHYEITRIAESILVLIKNAGTKIDFLFDTGEQLLTNAAYFESILLNLITNSLRYKTPDLDLQLAIDVYQEGEYKILSFTDNGIGIDLERYGDQLFGMYNTFNGNQDAKGMGLFIIKTQVEAMRGKIAVSSRLGAGTTFKIYFVGSSEKHKLIESIVT
jgi:PAS domain S-box-containing protein